MTALVIGASGHIGSHLVGLLKENGRRVRALVRNPRDATKYLHPAIDVVCGDVLDVNSLEAAMRDCHEVYHLASPTGLDQATEHAIVQGTKNVLWAADKARAVKTLVYTSSIVTIGYSRSPGDILDERSRCLTPATTYHVGKFVAESWALEFSSRCSFRLVIVNPATVVGPGDRRVTPSSAPIQRCMDRGLLCWFVGGLTISPVQDVARGHILAIDHGRHGERYILGGDRLTIEEYFAMIASCCHRKVPLVRLPLAMIWGAAACFSVARRCGVRKVPFTFRQARLLAGKYGWYSSAKAAGELGYSWRSPHEAIRGYVEWRQDVASMPELKSRRPGVRTALGDV